MPALRASWLAALAAAAGLLACGSSPDSADGGDAGVDCGATCPQPCRALGECDGGLGVDICDQGFCQSAGGPPLFALARIGLPLSFSGDQAASLVVRVLDTVPPSPGPALDCPTVLGGLDAGTLNVDDPLAVNPLLAAYSVSPHLPSGQDVSDFEVLAVPTGGMPLLLVEGFLGATQDGGAAAIGCTSYSATAEADGGAPTVGLELDPW